MAFAGALVFLSCPARADAPVLPGAGFAASRYEVLWTKSPFAVASAEGGQESPDYALKGIAQFDGISYASLIDKRSPGPEPEHFLLSSDKPVKGLTLVSISRGHDSSGTFAVIQKDGQVSTLKLETVSVAPVQEQLQPVVENAAPPATPGPELLPMPKVMKAANGRYYPIGRTFPP